MNWAQNLIALYDAHCDESGKEGEAALLPIYHSTAKAQVEITIDEDGDFVGAQEVTKELSATIIPVTEASGSRSSGIEPHPLCDYLKYVAGDYGESVSFVAEKKNNNKNYQEFFDAYLKLLGAWCNSPYSHPKIQAVYAYIKKAHVMQDLIDCGVLKVNENGKVTDEVKISSVFQTAAFVRFKVWSHKRTQERLLDSDGTHHEEVWLDPALYDAFIAYCNATEAGKDLCYLTGKRMQEGTLHPKKIRNEGDNTKLISSNDAQNFTYRGRFQNAGQAFCIGRESSQKMHNALKWIIRKQGYTRNGMCVVVWENNLDPILSVFDDTDSLFSDIDEGYTPDTNTVLADRLARAIEGYRTKLQPGSHTFIMSFDAAVTGRLAATYFKSFDTSKYFENIQNWHKTCAWMHAKYKDGNVFRFEGMASLYDIALALYATEQDGKLTLKTDSSGKAPMLAATFNRLLPCILEGARVPRDMVRLAVLRASSPLCYERNNWLKILAIACSFMKKQIYDDSDDKNKEEWKMAVNEECQERSYLYGRLLAVADRVEYLTYDKNEKRETNAKRYMNVFSRHPFRTWDIINKNIRPYFAKLCAKKGNCYSYLSDLMDEIIEKFEWEDFKNDEKLDGMYLLGFHNQSYELKNKSTENKKEDGTL